MVNCVLNIIEFRGMIAGFSSYGHRGIGRAVVGVHAGDNMFFVLFITTVLVKMDHPVGCIYRR